MYASTLRFFSYLTVFLPFSVGLSGADFGESLQVFADLAAGGGAVTQFAIHNPTTQPISVRVEIFESGGQGLADFSVDIAASGTASVSYGQPSDPLRVGWARLSSAGKFRATEFFQITLGDVAIPRVGVLPSALSDSTRIFCFITPDGTDTGMAIANPSQTDSVTLTAKLYDSAGTLTGTTQGITLGPSHQMANFLSEQPFFDELTNFQGTVELTSTGPVAVASLRSDNNLLSAVSVLTPLENLTPGSVTTEMLADAAVTGEKIADGAVVRSLNGLTDQVQLQAGPNVNIEAAGNTLTVSAAGATGDITAVTAGNGLTGGGSSGAVTLSVATDGIVSGMIDDGQVVKSVNGVRDAVTLAAGSNISVNQAGQTITIAGTAAGDITGVTAGSGLEGGGTSGTVTLSVANPLYLGTSTEGGSILLQRSAILPIVALGVDDQLRGAIGIGSGTSMNPLIAMGSPSGGGMTGRHGRFSIFRTGTQTAIVNAEETSSAGFFSVANSSGTVTASMDGATGTITGLTKNFLVDDPTDATRRIRYTSLEGPEAAMYLRGTADLVNGRAFIELPEHFRALAADGTLSVTLTPRSPASRGLAAVEVTVDGIEVAELFSGTGAYSFDYVVYAVRKGFEDYHVYEPKPPATEPEADPLAAAVAGVSKATPR